MARLVRGVLLAGIAAYGLALCGFWLARVVAGERWRAVACANNFVPWWSLGAVLAAGAAACLRRWAWAALQVPGIIAFGLLYGDLLWPPGTLAASAAGTPLTIATYNIQSAESDPEGVIDVIRDLDADIVGLQELGDAHQAAFEQHLSDEYPYQLSLPTFAGHGIGLLSRYPILSHEVLVSNIKYVRLVKVGLDIDGQPVTVLLAHPDPPEHVLSPLDYNAAARGTHLAWLRAEIALISGPLMVLCDCNMTDQSDDYRKLDALLNDAYRDAGWGLGFTFPAKDAPYLPVRLPLAVRIDYVWYNAGFAVQQAHVGDRCGSSDHHPVIVDLVLKQDTGTP
jgi:vancomycin resistance protein VanJ